jgi:RNA polymerase sigma-70 factor, ECF subfamily
VDSKRAVAVRSQLSLAQGGEATEPEFIVPAETVERLTARELETFLDRLSKDQRDALLLCDLWGFHYAEIAEIVDSPVGTVRSRIARARSRMSALLRKTARASEDRLKP